MDGVLTDATPAVVVGASEAGGIVASGDAATVAVAPDAGDVPTGDALARVFTRPGTAVDRFAVAVAPPVGAPFPRAFSPVAPGSVRSSPVAPTAVVFGVVASTVGPGRGAFGAAAPGSAAPVPAATGAVAPLVGDPPVDEAGGEPTVPAPSPFDAVWNGPVTATTGDAAEARSTPAVCRLTVGAAAIAYWLASETAAIGAVEPGSRETGCFRDAPTA
jgi:hypothetical protein